ncbi:hypothetical protein QYF61_015299 [Mycteria americana]|uniref:Uncharacterized protein n=1 Tax=Mycteria americana TaxID=33587 RepID=A0AAN7N8I6_MYCAM|nr:hypothetical protein QYF61_015299 [Mycteria americana]
MQILMYVFVPATDRDVTSEVQLHVLLVLRAPELDAVLQVRSHQSRVEGQNHLPRPAGHASSDAAQDVVGLLGCECTLSAHVQLFVHQYPHVLFRRAALDHIIPQPVLEPRIAPTQIHLSHFKLSSLIHLLVVLIFLSGLTLGYLEYSGPHILCIPDSKTLGVDLESSLVLSARGSSYTKSPPVPFWVLEIPSPGVLYAKDARSLWASHDGVSIAIELASDAGALHTNFRHMGHVHKKLGGGTARTADPNWPKGCSIPYDVMLSIETGGELAGGQPSLLWDGLGVGQQCLHRVTESQNSIGWKRPLRLSSPTVNLTLPRPPLHHVPKHLIQTSFKYLQGWRLNHFPGQPVPMLDKPFSEVKFPNIQSKPPLAQLEAISSCPITCYLGEETDPHLSTTSFQVVVEGNKVSPQPPFLQAKQPQLPQPLLIRLLLQTLHQLRCPSLHTLQHLNVSLVVRGPKLNTVSEVQPHQCRVQGHDHFPSPAGHAIFDTSQDAIGFLGHLGTLLAHIQAAVNQHAQVLLCWAAFQPLFPKPVALHGAVVTQVQDLALGLVKPHTIGPSPLIQPDQVPLQTLPTLKQINTPTQLGVICKLTEGALDPFIQIIDKDIKQNWPQHRALGNTACDWPPTGVNSIHHHSLGPAIQPVLNRAKSTPVQAMSSHSSSRRMLWETVSKALLESR